jgi:transcriptional regulator with XRE-family HTH domain
MAKHTYYIPIGVKIKEIREKGNISQLELAKAIGKESAAYMALIESGRRRVGIEELEKIASYLKTDISYFINRKEQKHTETTSKGLETVLRGDSNLNPSQKQQILNFYHFIQKKHNDK